MHNVKKLTFGPETDFQKKFEKVRVKDFADGWQNIELTPPPSNDSDTTKKELEVIKKSMQNNTRKTIKTIMQEDKEYPGFELLFGDVIKKDDPKMRKFIDDLSDQIFKICLFFKNKYQRPRPFQVAAKLGIPFEPLVSETADSSSYPSGHAFAAYLIAAILGEKFPNKINELEKLAKRVAQNRINAGVHFPSDVEAGKLLAKKVFPYYKKSKKLHFKEWFN